jgi:ribosomal protein S18 acetylase RimI-like enzyme
MSTADTVRLATVADAADVGRMLHDFSVEYDDVTPGADAFAARVGRLIEEGHVTVLLGGEGPDGFALFRFAPSLYSEADECYLAELYVAPQQRGHGLGEALLAATLEHARGRADYVHLGTTEDDVAARGLYEKLGFRRTEGDDGPVMYVYERDL